MNFFQINKNKKIVAIIGFFLLLSIAIGSLFNIKGSKGHISDMAKLYKDDFIYKNAFNEVSKNQNVTDLFGELKPIKLNVLEDHVKYSKGNTIVNITTKLKGEKRKGKLDIVAHKIDDKWYYTNIKIRVKRPHETIYVIE